MVGDRGNFWFFGCVTVFGMGRFVFFVFWVALLWMGFDHAALLDVLKFLQDGVV